MTRNTISIDSSLIEFALKGDFDGMRQGLKASEDGEFEIALYSSIVSNQGRISGLFDESNKRESREWDSKRILDLLSDQKDSKKKPNSNPLFDLGHQLSLKLMQAYRKLDDKSQIDVIEKLISHILRNSEEDITLVSSYIAQLDLLLTQQEFGLMGSQNCQEFSQDIQVGDVL